LNALEQIIMFFKSSSSSLAVAALAAVALARPQIPGEVLYGTVGNSTIAGIAAKPGPDGKYTITGVGIRANFVPYGASISNLFINDTSGCERDIVGGWDNATYYTEDKQHPHFGGVPGRYANRIKNSSFEIDGTTYHVLPDENPEPGSPNGVDTLHGGPDGWDWRNWTVVAHTASSITFSITDPDGDQGFPGEVVSYVTYSLGNMTWDFKMVAVATEKKTPIMLSSHVSVYILIPWRESPLTPTDLLEPRRLGQQRDRPGPEPLPLDALRRPARRHRLHPHPHGRHPVQPAQLQQRLLDHPQADRRQLHQPHAARQLRRELHRL
jgi:hypothetical protein